MGHHRGETSRDLVLLRIEQGDTCQLQGPGGATVGGVRGVGGDHEPLDVRKPLRTEVPELVRVFFHPRFPRCEVLAALLDGTISRHKAELIANATQFLDSLATGDCDHRYESRGHDPGVKLRHLTHVRNSTCTSPICRRPASQCDFEHNTPYEAGGRTCLCNGGPKCRHDHRLKQDPKWTVDQLPDGTFRWTTPTGRQYTTEPTRYPI